MLHYLWSYRACEMYAVERRVLIGSVPDRQNIRQLVVLSVEKWNGSLNSKYNEYVLVFGKSPSVHEILLRDSKFGVWCGVGARKIIGAMFFEERRFDMYVLMPFLRELTVEWRHGFFIQEVPRRTQISRCTGRERWRTADSSRIVASWGLFLFFVANLFFVFYFFYLFVFLFFVEVT